MEREDFSLNEINAELARVPADRDRLDVDDVDLSQSVNRDGDGKNLTESDERIFSGAKNLLEPRRVRLLDSHSINQIAAGEVVERPASVVKELLENALDAGSRRIEIFLEESGRQLIEIRDDGCGMEPDDARLSLQRHATSKISDVADLGKLWTLGFRGEALPSIASVSRFKLSTATQEGTRFTVCQEGNERFEEGFEAGPKGTTIRVEDLFFNTPARLRFLKSNVTELGAIQDHVGRYALAYPEVFLRLSQGKRVLLESPGDGDALNALGSVWGHELAQSLIPIQMVHEGIRVWGYCSSPTMTRATRSQQWIFVNRRPVRNRALLVALDTAYRQLTPERRFPIVSLFIDMDPALVDMNVSPTKTEVRFQFERRVFDAVRLAVKSGLLASGLVPSAEELARANEAMRSVSGGEGALAGGSAESGQQTLRSETSGASPQEYGGFRQPPRFQRNLIAWEYLLSDSPSPVLDPEEREPVQYSPASDSSPVFSPSQDGGLGSDDDFAQKVIGGDRKVCPTDLEFRGSFQSESQQGEVAEARDSESSRLAGLSTDLAAVSVWEEESEQNSTLSGFSRFLDGLAVHGQTGDCFYIIAENRDGLMIVDQHVAHERILFEYLRALRGLQDTEIQPLLTPLTVELDRRSMGVLMEHQDALAAAGFSIEVFGEQSALLTAIPAALKRQDPIRVLKDLLDDLDSGEFGSRLSPRENVWVTCACKMAIKAGERLGKPEMEKLLLDLAETENPYFCPHGRPIIIQLGWNDLLKKFKRG